MISLYSEFCSTTFLVEKLKCHSIFLSQNIAKANLCFKDKPMKNCGGLMSKLIICSCFWTSEKGCVDKAGNNGFQCCQHSSRCKQHLLFPAVRHRSKGDLKVCLSQSFLLLSLVCEPHRGLAKTNSNSTSYGKKSNVRPVCLLVIAVVQCF